MDASVVEFKPETSHQLYSDLAEYQRQPSEWELTPLMDWLHVWHDRIVDHFDLNVGNVSLCVEWLSRHRLGHFRYGRNGFGLLGEIAINQRYLNRAPWQIIGTLFHELLHAWQNVNGKPGKGNYHNKEFQDKARSYGLIIDTRGYTQYESESRLQRFLALFDLQMPELPEVKPCAVGSKLIKWSCQCKPAINVRVAVAHFHAKCLWCGHPFRKC